MGDEPTGSREPIGESDCVASAAPGGNGDTSRSGCEAAAMGCERGTGNENAGRLGAVTRAAVRAGAGSTNSTTLRKGEGTCNFTIGNFSIYSSGYATAPAATATCNTNDNETV